LIFDLPNRASRAQKPGLAKRESKIKSQRSTMHSLRPESNAFTEEERQFLLRVTRHAIEAALERRGYTPQAPAGKLTEPRGVFTTVYVAGQLRGCVGHVLAVEPLAEAVAQTAVSAAFQDPRFPPLRAAELPQLGVSLSVLSPLFPITADAVEIGRHGLLVSLGAQRGLLLPQVPLEWGWDREEFLAQTCRKAGLPRDAWRRGAELLAFTAEVFGDQPPPAPEPKA
jgi:uncharacterized protein